MDNDKPLCHPEPFDYPSMQFVLIQYNIIVRDLRRLDITVRHVQRTPAAGIAQGEGVRFAAGGAGSPGMAAIVGRKGQYADALAEDAHPLANGAHAHGAVERAILAAAPQQGVISGSALCVLHQVVVRRSLGIRDGRLQVSDA